MIPSSGRIRQFHDHVRSKRQLADLIERMYVFADKFDYVEARSFIDSYNDRLPELKPYFINCRERVRF